MSQRPINPDALRPYAVPEIRPQLGAGAGVVWRYTIFVPVEEIKSDGNTRSIATAADRDCLEAMLPEDFGGVTAPAVVAGLKGLGPRDPAEPVKTRELNIHTYYMVYAAVHEASDRYFRALRKELEEALVEGVILVERQEVTIL